MPMPAGYLRKSYRYKVQKRRSIPKLVPTTRRAIGKIRRFLPLAGFPEKKFVKLRYVETITLTPGTSTPYVFACNGLFDPNITGTGHQPYGFSQWRIIYNHYKVLSSVMKLRATNGGAAQTGTIYGIKVDDNASTTLTINSLMEQKDSKYRVIVGQNAPSVLTKKWSLRRSMDPSLDSVQAEVTANPSDMEFFNIYCGQAEPNATGGTLALQVQIDYYVQFSELKDFANS